MLFRWARVNAAIARINALETAGDVAGPVGELQSDVSFGRYMNLRAHAVLALGRVGDVSAVPDIVEVAGDPEETVRMVALGALGHLKAQGVTDTLMKGWRIRRLPSGWQPQRHRVAYGLRP
jgi:HEAT repeat protein